MDSSNEVRKRSGSKSNRLRKDRPDSGKPGNEASSGRSSYDGERRVRPTEHDTDESAKRGIPFTDPILMNEGKDIPYKDMDVQMQPPPSQSTASSPAKHQAQSDPSPPPVPDKGRANIASEGDTDSQHQENYEENERLEQQQRQAHQQKLRREAKEHEAKERDKEERRKASIDKKKHELEGLRSQVGEANVRYEALTRTNQKLKEELIGLNSEWSRDLQLLEEQRQILNASRSFAAREGTLDAATLIQSFNDLNSSIGDFSFEVLRGLDENADTRPLGESDYGRLYETLANPNLKFFVEQISHRELKASDVVDPIVTGIIAADLMSVIFEPFAPGLDQDRSNVLKRMYRNMQESEPQERSARWRSITYNHAIPNQDPESLRQAANESVSKVALVLTALSGGATEINPPEDYYNLVYSIFEAAVKVQNRAMTEYVSFDYEVYAVLAKSKYDKMRMDVSQAGNEDPSQVWITIGLGMKARRRIQGVGDPNVELSIPVKPMVICDNWDHNA